MANHNFVVTCHLRPLLHAFDVGLLRTTINRLKQERCVTPKLAFIREGQDDASQFENYLIEEQEVNGSGFSSGTGFVSFLEEITRDVVEYLKQE